MQIEALFSDSLVWIAAGAGAGITAVLGLVYHRMAQQSLRALMQQQHDSDERLSQAEIQRLQQHNQTLQDELDGMDIERDRLSAELRTHTASFPPRQKSCARWKP